MRRHAFAGRARALAAALAASLALAVGFAPGAAAQGRGTVTIIRDAETETLLRSIYGPLFNAAGLSRGFVRVTIIRDRSINAFVTTGNRMFIHTGLIMQAGSVGEVAGVLAHETGHVVGGHIARLPEEIRNAQIRAVVASLLGMGAAVATGQGAAAGVGAVAGTSMALRELFSFTRTQENAADHTAVNLLNRLNWPVSGLLDLMERLQGQELMIADRQDPYMRTHPLTRDRIDFIRERIAARGRDGALPGDMDRSFAMVRAKLFGFLESGAAIQREYPRDDMSEPARYARAIQTFRAGRIDEAVAEIDRLIAANPSSPWLHEVKGQVLFEGSGRNREAVEPYRQAVRLAPAEPLIRSGLARVLLSLEEPAQLRAAAAEAEAALRLDNSLAMAWHTLGMARGRLGEEGLATLALAEEAALNGDLLTQRQMAARAERLLPPGPGKLRAQDLANAARIEREERRRRQ
ncbi:M48 family metalloprotease [Elioraea rosea]|uniref:M48 family metalloprotease n=1 Tax=Elioraea rosea TaxID=2492390 RepID=UPI001185327F|nr:M48 family metalloprotease [Elioraea rosea]